MGLLEVLTVIFVVLKIVGIITWSWWLVFLPMIISVGLYILWFIFAGLLIGTSADITISDMKEIRKR